MALVEPGRVLVNHLAIAEWSMPSVWSSSIMAFVRWYMRDKQHLSFHEIRYILIDFLEARWSAPIQPNDITTTHTRVSKMGGPHKLKISDRQRKQQATPNSENLSMPNCQGQFIGRQSLQV